MLERLTNPRDVRTRTRVMRGVATIAHNAHETFSSTDFEFSSDLFLINLASAKPWRGIVRPQSSRADVLRILGNLFAPTTSMILMRVLSESCNVSDAIVLRLC